MAEDEEKKEEQYGIGSTSEVEWISLEQAGVLAMRTAREAPGNYGRPFSGTRMVFDVTEREDGEDFYIISLSFRPEGDFAGTPGQEQFFIEKEGSVAVRQVRSLPMRQGQRRFPWIPIVIVASLVVVIGAVAGVLFAAGMIPPGAGSTPTPVKVQPGQVKVALAPDRPARLISPRGDVTVDLSAGSVDQPVELVYQGLSSAQIPSLPSGFNASEKLFDLSVAGPQAADAGQFSFTKPVTITVRFEADHAMRAGGVESNLVLQHYQGAERRWTTLPTTVDFSSSTAKAQVDSLSIFALTIKEPTPTPTTPAAKIQEPAPTPTTPAAKIQEPTPTHTPAVVPSFQLKVNGRPVTGPGVATTNATVGVSPPPNAPDNRYFKGTEVNLSLSPASGFTGSCETSSIMMTSDLEVGCSVSRKAYTLSIQGRPVTGPSLAMPEGTVNLSPAPNAPGSLYSHGTVVNLSLSPAGGFSGFCDTLAVTITSDRDISCTLTPQSHVLSIGGVPVRAGETGLNVANGIIGLSDAPGSDGRYAGNVEVTLFASANAEGATIIWGGVDTEDFEFATVQMDRDRFVTVDFVLPRVVDSHGDFLGNATPISAGVTPGAIDPSDDLDFFRFSAQAGTTYTIEVILDTHSDTELILYDPQ